MEEDCHKLDLELAREASPTPLDRASFREHAQLITQLNKDEDSRRELIQFTQLLQQVLANLAIQLPNFQSSPQLQSLQSEFTSAQKKLADLVSYIHIIS